MLLRDGQCYSAMMQICQLQGDKRQLMRFWEAIRDLIEMQDYFLQFADLELECFDELFDNLWKSIVVCHSDFCFTIKLKANGCAEAESQFASAQVHSCLRQL